MIPHLYDSEIAGMVGIRNRMPLERRPMIDKIIRNRMAYIDAGLRAGFRTEAHRAAFLYDPLLRARIDFLQDCIILERRADALGFWVQVAQFPNHYKPSFREVTHMLFEGDMQRVGAKEFRRQRDEKSAKVRESNEKAGVEKVEAAVDSIGNKRLKEFQQVERARHTGETVISHGDDHKFLERTAEREKSEER